MRIARFLISALLLLLSTLLTLYGLLLLVYEGEGAHPERSDTSTYVTIAGHQLHARPVGAVCLVIAGLVVAVAIAFVRPRRRLAE